MHNNKHICIKEARPFTIRFMPADGNCLFNACFQWLRDKNLLTDINTVHAFRQHVMDYIASDPSHVYKKQITAIINTIKNIHNVYDQHIEHEQVDPVFIEIMQNLQQRGIPVANADLTAEYVKIMRQDTTWGGDLELSAIRKIFKVNIIIYSSMHDDGNYVFADSMTFNSEALFLYLSGNTHYDLLIYNQTLQANAIPMQPAIQSPPELHTELDHKTLQFQHDTAKGWLLPNTFKRVKTFFSTLTDDIYQVVATTHSLDEADLHINQDGKLEDILHYLNLAEEFRPEYIFKNFSKLYNSVLTDDLGKASLNQDNQIYYDIYQFFNDFVSVEHNINTNKATKVTIHKHARLAYTLANDLVAYSKVNLSASQITKVMQCCMLLCAHAKEKSLPTSALIVTELPQLTSIIQQRIKAYKTHGTKLHFISSLFLLHLSLQEMRDSLDLTWFTRVQVYSALSKIYMAVGLHNIGHLYAKNGVELYEKFIDKLHVATIMPPSIDKATKTNVDENYDLFATAPQNADTEAILHAMEKAAVNDLDQVPVSDLSIVYQQDALWAVLDNVLGVFLEEELCTNKNKLLPNFQALLAAQSIDDIYVTLHTLLKTNILAEQNYFAQQKIDNHFAAQKYFFEQLSIFLLYTIRKRNELIKVIAIMEKSVYQHFTTYEFAQQEFSEHDKCVLREFINCKNDTVKHNLDLTIQAVKFMTKNGALSELYANSVLLPSLDKAQTNLSTILSYLLDKLRILAQIALQKDAEPEIVVQENRQFIVFNRETIVLSQILPIIKQKISGSIYKHEIHLIGKHTIFVDQHLNERISHDDKTSIFSGINFLFMTQNLRYIKVKKLQIDLAGSDAQDPRSTAAIDGAPTVNIPGRNGNPGKHGHNGINGNPGGNLSIVCNSHSGDMNSFDFHAKGGNGSDGGNGGNGSDGIRGANGANGKVYMTEMLRNGATEYQAKGSWWIGNIYKHNTQHYPATSDETLTTYPWRRRTTSVLGMVLGQQGQSGGKGGYGGNGGCKGLGGKGGRFDLTILERSINESRTEQNGADGKDGSCGKGGKHADGGLPGLDCFRLIPRQSFWGALSGSKPEVEQEQEGFIDSAYFTSLSDRTSWVGQYFGDLKAPRYEPADVQEILKRTTKADKATADDGKVINDKRIAHSNHQTNLNLAITNFENTVNDCLILNDKKSYNFATALAKHNKRKSRLHKIPGREHLLNENFDNWQNAIKASLENVTQEIAAKQQLNATSSLKQQISTYFKPRATNTHVTAKEQPKKKITSRLSSDLDFGAANDGIANLLDTFNQTPDINNLAQIIAYLNNYTNLNKVVSTLGLQSFAELLDSLIYETCILMQDRAQLGYTSIKAIIDKPVFVHNQELSQYFQTKIAIYERLDKLKITVLESTTTTLTTPKHQFQEYIRLFCQITLNSRNNLAALDRKIKEDQFYLHTINDTEYIKILTQRLKETNVAKIIKSALKYDTYPSFAHLMALIKICLASAHLQLTQPDVFYRFTLQIKHNLHVHGRMIAINDAVNSLLYNFNYNLDLYQIILLSIFDNCPAIEEIYRQSTEKNLLAKHDYKGLDLIIDNLAIFKNLPHNYLYMPQLLAYSTCITDQKQADKIYAALYQIIKASILSNRIATTTDLHYYDQFKDTLTTPFLQTANISLFAKALKYIINNLSDEPKLFLLTAMHSAHNISNLKFKKHNSFVASFTEFEPKILKFLNDDLLKATYAKRTKSNNQPIYKKYASKFKQFTKELLAFVSRDNNEYLSYLHITIVEMNNICIKLQETLDEATLTKLQLKLILDGLKIIIALTHDIAELGENSEQFTSLITSLKSLQNKLDVLWQQSDHIAQMEYCYEVMKVSTNYNSFASFMSDNRAGITEFFRKRYNTTKKEETNPDGSMAFNKINAILEICKLQNYYYLEFNINEVPSWLSINNQLIAKANNITLLQINSDDGTIIKIKHFAHMQQQELIQAANVQTLRHNESYMLKCKDSILHDETFNALNIQKPSINGSECVIVFNKHAQECVVLREPGMYKVSNSIFMNLKSCEDDHLLTIADHMAKKFSEPNFVLDRDLRADMFIEDYRAKSTTNMIATATNISSTHKIDSAALLAISVDLETIASSWAPDLRPALFSLNKQTIELVFETASSGYDATLLQQKQLLKTIIQAKDNRQINQVHLHDIISAGLNFSSPGRISQLIKANNLNSLFAQLCIERFIDCYIATTPSFDPIALKNISTKLFALNEQLLKMFYKKYISDYYNTIYHLDNAKDKHAIFINENRILSIINTLELIKVDDESLVALLNTPFMNWEQKLLAIHASQVLNRIPMFRDNANELIELMLNRIRIRLDSPLHFEFIAFVEKLGSKYNLDPKSLEIFISRIYRDLISFEEAMRIVTSYPAHQWHNVDIIQPGLDIDAEGLNYKQILDIIERNHPQFKHKIGLIRTIAEQLVSDLARDMANKDEIDIRQIIDALLYNLYQHTGIKQSEAWLLQHNNADLINLRTFVHTLCLAWSFAFPQTRPRQTQIVAVTLFLLMLDSGLLSQIKTGQGKTMIVGMLACAKALLGYKVDIISSNIDLAHKGNKACTPFFKLFNLQSETLPDDTKSTDYYRSHILYGNATLFQRDICIAKIQGNDMFHGRYKNNYSEACLFVDEVDSLSLDKAVEMLYLTHPHPALKHLDFAIQNIHIAIQQFCNAPNFNVYDVNRDLDKYVNIIANRFIVNGEVDQSILVPPYLHTYFKQQIYRIIKSGFRAMSMKADDNFRVISQAITAMDKPTGVEAHSTTYSDGLQQHLELRFGSVVKSMGLCSNFISNQSFFKLYSNNLFGLTGTLGNKESRSFLEEVYKVMMVDIPPHMPSKFIRTADLVCLEDDWAHIVSEEAFRISATQPTLIICENVSEADCIYKVLQSMLEGNNANKNIYMYKEETDDIEQALSTKQGATVNDIIIATNKGGRGTDINVNLEQANGGLHVILSNIPGNSRIEEQAFGRAARNGAPGSGNFIIKVAEKTGEDDQLQLEKMIIARDEQESIRIREIQERDIPQVKLKETLLHSYFETRKAMLDILNKLGLDDELKNGYTEVLNHRWAFWLETIKDDIDKLTNVDSELHASIFNKYITGFKAPVDKIINYQDITLELLTTPEDAIIIANIYFNRSDFKNAMIYFDKAAKAGDATGYAHAAAAVCYANLHTVNTIEHKKSLRSYVKKAADATGRYKKFYQNSSSLQQVLYKNKTLADQNFVDLHVQALESRLGVLSVHTDQMKKSIGGEISIAKICNVLNTSERAASTIIKHLHTSKIISKNFIRKRWTKEKNHAQLKKLLGHEHQFFVVPKIAYEVISNPKNLDSDIFTNTTFLEAIYNVDDLIRTLQNAKILCATNKTCLRIDRVNLASFVPKPDTQALWESIVPNFQHYDDLLSLILYEDSEIYKIICNTHKLYEELVIAQVIVKTTEYTIAAGFKPDNFNLSTLDFGKYQSLVIPRDGNTLTNVIDTVAYQLQNACKNQGNKLYENDLPFTPLQQRIVALHEWLHQESNILKSNTIRTDLKYHANTKTLQQDLIKIFANIKGVEVKLLIPLFKELQGSIRSVDGTVVGNFISPKALNNDEAQELNYDFFSDVMLDKILVFNESAFWFYVDIACLIIIAIIQFVAGACLIAFVPGIGALLGEALLELAIQDLFFAGTQFISGERVNWAAWSQQKVIASALTIGSSFTFGFGVPYAKGALSGARRFFTTVAKSLATNMATIVTSKVLSKLAMEVANQVSDRATRHILQETTLEFQRAYDQLEQNYGYLDEETVDHINRNFMNRINLIMLEDRNNSEFVNAISKAASTAGNTIHHYTQSSNNQTIRTIGTVINASATVGSLASIFTHACQLNNLGHEVSAKLEENNRTLLDAYISYENKSTVAQNAQAKTNFSVAVTHSANEMHTKLSDKFIPYIYNLIAAPISKMLNVQISPLLTKEAKQANKQHSYTIAQDIKQLNYSFLTHMPPQGYGIVEDNKFVPVTYKIDDLSQYLQSPADAPCHTQHTSKIKRSADIFRNYSENLDTDPYGMFELPLIAEREDIAIRLYTPAFTMLSIILPKHTAQKSVRKVVDIVETKTEFNPTIYRPVQYDNCTIKGKPIPSPVDTDNMLVPPHNTLMFSVLFGLRNKAPSHQEIDNYRHDLADSCLKANPKCQLANDKSYSSCQQSLDHA